MMSLYAVDSTVRQWIDWRRFHSKCLRNEYNDTDIAVKITEDEFRKMLFFYYNLQWKCHHI